MEFVTTFDIQRGVGRLMDRVMGPVVERDGGSTMTGFDGQAESTHVRLYDASVDQQRRNQSFTILHAFAQSYNFKEGRACTTSNPFSKFLYK